MTSENYQRLRSLCQRLADALRRRRLTPDEKALLAEADEVLTSKRGPTRKISLEAIAAALKEHGSVAAAAKALDCSESYVYQQKRKLK